MGRHSSHQQVDFMKSAFMWFLPWLLAAVVGIGALWIGIDAALGGDSDSPSDQRPGRAGAAAGPSPSTEATATETPVVESPPETEDDDPAKDQPKDKPRKKKQPRLISDGVRVQVLNGTTLPDADDRIATELEALGFEIVATNDWHATPISIVYWSTPADQKAATLLADKLGWIAQPKPAELSTEVRLHVLVGADGTIDLEP
jgi:hypothetical protein